MSNALKKIEGMSELLELIGPDMEPTVRIQRLDVCHAQITRQMGANDSSISLVNFGVEASYHLFLSRLHGIMRSPTLGYKIQNIIRCCIAGILSNDAARQQGDRQPPS